MSVCFLENLAVGAFKMRFALNEDMDISGGLGAEYQMRLVSGKFIGG